MIAVIITPRQSLSIELFSCHLLQALHSLDVEKKRAAAAEEERKRAAAAAAAAEAQRQRDAEAAAAKKAQEAAAAKQKVRVTGCYLCRYFASRLGFPTHVPQAAAAASPQAAAAARIAGKPDIVTAARKGNISLVGYHITADPSSVNQKDKQ
jgi:hypothetical protein